MPIQTLTCEWCAANATSPIRLLDGQLSGVCLLHLASIRTHVDEYGTLVQDEPSSLAAALSTVYFEEISDFYGMDGDVVLQVEGQGGNLAALVQKDVVFPGGSLYYVLATNGPDGSLLPRRDDRSAERWTVGIYEDTISNGADSDDPTVLLTAPAGVPLSAVYQLAFDTVCTVLDGLDA